MASSSPRVVWSCGPRLMLHHLLMTLVSTPLQTKVKNTVYFIPKGIVLQSGIQGSTNTLTRIFNQESAKGA